MDTDALALPNGDPVSAFRNTLRRRNRTKRGRAEAAAAHKARPVEPPKALGALLGAARETGLAPFAFVLLQLDAGLREGEALGLRWGRVAWGQGPNNTRRHLLIDGNRARGGALEAPKSGRERRVELSRRLRGALRELYMAQGQPDNETLLFPDLEPNNFRHRTWKGKKGILARAGLPGVRMKDLRDSFAGYLLTAGVQLGYISAQPRGRGDHGKALRALGWWRRLPRGARSATGRGAGGSAREV